MSSEPQVPGPAPSDADAEQSYRRLLQSLPARVSLYVSDPERLGLPVDQEAKPKAELEGLRWLFQIVLGVSLVNGTRIFWTGTVSGTGVQSWSALINWTSLYFAVFAAEILVTTLGGVFLLQALYAPSNPPGRTRSPQHIIDACVVLSTGILFNGISLTLANPRDGSLQYFTLFGVIFVLQALWFGALAIRPRRQSPAQPLAKQFFRQVAPIVFWVFLLGLLHFGLLPSTDLLLLPIGLDVLLAGWLLSTSPS